MSGILNTLCNQLSCCLPSCCASPIDMSAFNSIAPDTAALPTSLANFQVRIHLSAPNNDPSNNDFAEVSFSATLDCKTAIHEKAISTLGLNTQPTPPTSGKKTDVYINLSTLPPDLSTLPPENEPNRRLAWGEHTLRQAPLSPLRCEARNEMHEDTAPIKKRSVTLICPPLDPKSTSTPPKAPFLQRKSFDNDDMPTLSLPPIPSSSIFFEATTTSAPQQTTRFSFRETTTQLSQYAAPYQKTHLSKFPK